VNRHLHVLGRYVLSGEIAYGGMGSVHLGRLLGEAGFARTVAIKRLHPQFARDPEFVSMFLDEARLVARIRHPNVVPTLDVARVDGELFIVMEYVHGESLAGLLRAVADGRGAAPPSVIAPIVAGLLHGLHAAHEATNERGEALGLVHRDVSPQNVLVGTDGGARVVDFGIAKAGGRSQLTRGAQLKGKLAYMAPEQARGSATRLSDVFAAGVVLWEALTLHRLFDADTDAEIMANVIGGPIEPPSLYAPSVSPELDALTMRALARDPAERFQSAREMARALERCVPFVPLSEVGEWVESLVPDVLAQRAAKIAGIERAALTQTVSPSLPTLPAPSPTSDVPSATVQVRTRALPTPSAMHARHASAPTRIAIDLPPSGQREPIAPTPFSTGSNTGSRAEPERRAPAGTRTLKGAGLGIACALAIVIAVYAAFSKDLLAFSSIVQEPGPRSAVLARVAREPNAAPTAPLPAVPQSVPPPEAPLSLRPPAVAAPKAPSPSSTAPAAAVRSRAPRMHCTPPYTIDENGDRRYKRECYR
jgi:serine/threonine protein kinase